MKRLLSHAIASVVLLAASAGAANAQNGAALYKDVCAACHDAGLDRAPARDELQAMTPERVLAALESGAMISMTSGRTAAERRAVAEYVTGKSFASPLDTRPSPQAMCAATSARGSSSAFNGAAWTGWGVNTSNTRLQTTDAAGFT